MVSVPKIGWGKYKGFEGPFFMGSIPYSLPTEPTEEDRRLRVVTATEGGTYDAVNMYDQCIVSVGLIQWCETAGYLTSRLLHGVCEAGGAQHLTQALKPALDASGAEFKKNLTGQWRFFLKGKEVTTRTQQQELFLGCDGREGSWTDEARSRARLWALCMANVWTDPKAREVQANFTKPRLMGFIIKDARQLLWDSTPDTGWNGMLRAAYLSFAANNPQKANDNVVKAAATTMARKWSPDWCIHVLKQLTFGPNIAIYGERYNKIRPWLEKLWSGVELPKDAGALKAWIAKTISVTPEPVVIPALPPLPVIEQPTVEEVGEDRPTVEVVLPEVLIEASKPGSPVPEELPSFKSDGILAFILKLLMKLFGKK